MSNFHVGQIVYVVLNRRNCVQPFRVVEIITKKTLSGEQVNYRLQGGDNVSTMTMLDELDGEIFETAEDVRQNLVERASIQIDKIVDDAMSVSIDWFGSSTSSSEKVVHELPGSPSDTLKSKATVSEKLSPKVVMPAAASPKITGSNDDTTPVIMPDGSVVRVRLPQI